MSNMHAGHPFSARVPGDVLARWRAAVAANGETQTAVLVAMMTEYADQNETSEPDATTPVQMDELRVGDTVAEFGESRVTETRTDDNGLWLAFADESGDYVDRPTNIVHVTNR